MVSLRSVLCILILTLTWSPAISKASEEGDPIRRLIVGTKEAPPFSMKTDEGLWTGISIELWRQIATELNLAYEFRELDLRGLLQGLADGSLDVAVAALTITSERENLFDFTHPFYTTGLGIAALSKEGSPWVAVLKRFFSLAFLKAITALFLLLLTVGFLVWWFEKRKNPGQFGGSTTRGIGSAFWFSAVTMTTVGYGDKAPRTLGGRIVTLIWMFAAIIVISSMTAAITSALTVSQLESPVKGIQDLPKVRVGTIKDSTSAAYLKRHRISFLPFSGVREGLQAVSRGEIEALVYDAPVMRYLAHKEYRGKLRVLPDTFMRQDYGVGLQAGSPLRETINAVLLEKISEPEWQDLLYRFLG